MNIAKIFPPRN